MLICSASGPIAAIIRKPDEIKDKYPVAILMHGFMANKNLEPLKSIAEKLAENGIASIRFDFNGHGQSYGRFRDMTVLNEIEDARAVYNYISSQYWVSGVSLVGHSQGGVVAGMLAGEWKEKISSLVQLCAAAVLKDDALNGVLMGRHYNPENPPETLWVLFHRVGRSYFKVARELPIYEVSAQYEGPVCLIHGTKDKIVPLSYSEKYKACYKNSELFTLEKETHFLNKRRKEVVSICVEFIKSHIR